MNTSTADTLIKLATLLYGCGMAGYLLYLFKQRDIHQKTAFILVCSALEAHLAGLVIYTAAAGHVPVHNLSQSLSLSALAIGGMFVFFQYRFDLKILGVFAAILLTSVMTMVWILPDAPVEKNEALKGFWFYSHIVMVFGGNAALALACGTGILYLLQEQGIKSKSPGFFFKRLPSLDFLDSAGHTCLAVGFALLSIGLVTGFIYARAIWGRFWSWDPKELFSVATWLIYAALLHFRFHSGWRGRKSAVMTIVGFGVILFTFLGVNLLLGGHHQEFTK